MVIRGFRDDSVSNFSNVQSNSRAELKKSDPGTSLLSGRAKSEKLSAQRNFRQSLIESLEVRNLMAGPQLIGIQPNNSDLIEEGVIRNVAPRELTFRFDESQIINPATTGGIRLTRSGGDGTFGLNSLATDFGSGGKVDIQLTMKSSGQTLTVNVTKADLGTGSPTFNLNGAVLNVTLNSNPVTPTTAGQLVNAINSDALLQGTLSAAINGGFADAKLGVLTPTGFGPLRINQTNDQTITPASSVVSNAPKQNEVKLQFAETLVDDAYRIEVFGFDNQQSGIVGLRNTAGELFAPRAGSVNSEIFNFRLDLGSKILGVVPQPVVRNAADGIEQMRNQIVVYFDNDKLLVENDSAGNPTLRSAENADFYQLIYTSDTIRNTDDVKYNPTRATYNATANLVTLEYFSYSGVQVAGTVAPGALVPSSQLSTIVNAGRTLVPFDINNLKPAGASNAAYRLRVGTRESLPFVPTRLETAATAISDLNTNGAARLKFTSRLVGEGAAAISVNFATNPAAGAVVVSVAGNVVSVTMAPTSTVSNVITAIRASAAASALIDVSLEENLGGSTEIGSRPVNYSPVRLVGLGDTFTTATNIGTIGSQVTPLSSFVFTSDIKNTLLGLDNVGSSDDPAHRDLGPASFDNHINSQFGVDSNPGITKIYYNFRSDYGTENGVPLTNSITGLQQTRTREALQMWSRYLGVQFVETPNLGITIATGSRNVLNPFAANVRAEDARNFRVRIDPTFANGLLVLESSRSWNENYGEDYYRHVITGIGMLLGLTHANDLPASTLLAMNPGFLNGNGGPSNQESVFPGAQDVLHGQFIHKADNSDIDLYRFEVNFGADEPGRVGAFEAETFSERAEQSSSLDTYLMLYRENLAVAVSNFGATNGLGVKFTSVQPGKLGNNLQILVSRSQINSGTPGFSNNTVVQVFPNLISIELNSTTGSETTIDQLLTALQTNSAVRSLVKVELTSDSPANAGATKIGINETSYSPITLLGGGMELIAQNDNYFSEDSLLRLSLGSGVYYLGVSAAGNSAYDPTIPNSGTGGRTEGRYDLRMTFRAQTDAQDSITDTSTRFVGDQSQSIDGDADGVPGGVYDFWFETRPLNRVVSVNAGGSASLEGQVISITGANGVTRRLEFSSDPFVSVGNTRIPYTIGSTNVAINSDLINAINSLTGATGITATPINVPGGSTSFTLVGERTLSIPSTVTVLDVAGKTIFVDKLAGPNSDGSLAKPFNNIQNSTVANAFGSALPGDIVRIVGNGGNDRNLSTVGDNIAYEFGFGLLGNASLTDGVALEVPQGVIAMVDAGAIFKSRRSRIAVGSSNGNIDRSGSSLQVLGTPVLVSNNNVLRDAAGQAVSGSVFFTSWLDETIGRDSYGPSTTPSKGDWGGIVLQRDIDRAAAKPDKEDNGIFLNYINFADIRYGGGGGVVIDSVQQVVNPIQIVDGRPTITYNNITRSADAAVSASPNSFEETIFTDKIYQAKGAFTPDYDRVGPSIHDNRLVDNSVNGLFIRVTTLPADTPKNVTVPGRFDDIDITHVLSENLIINGNPGGSILDYTRPSTQFMVPTATIGGTLAVGTYNYKVTFVDSFGNESIPSPATSDVTLGAGQTAVDMQGIPSVLGSYTGVRIYRSQIGAMGPYDLVAQLTTAANSFLDRGLNLGGTLKRDQLNVSGVSSTATAGGTLQLGTYTYKVVMIDGAGREGIASDASVPQIVSVNSDRTLELTGLPTTFGDYVGRRIYRSQNTGGGNYQLVAELLNANAATVTTFSDSGASLGVLLSPESQGVIRSRLDSSLVIDPGATLKIEGARIELGQGTQLLAEGTENLPIVITSKLDDSVGSGGTFDSNNDTTLSRPAPGNWGGILAMPGSTVSLDYTTIAYAGGVTRLEGTFRSFNALEVQQADLRVANSTFKFNANGVGGQGSATRFGRLANEPATVLIRGASPIFVNNSFESNTSNNTNSVSPTRSAAISIDANSMTNVIRGDTGRMTGSIDRITTSDTNRGPLFRGNSFNNNDLNGLKIRADSRSTNADDPTSTTNPVTDIKALASDALAIESTWDDTDIVHVLYDGIFIENQQHGGSLSLLSSATESLVVKMIGAGSNFDPLRGTGFTAGGEKSSISDRVGGSIYVIGQPGFPVILTSLRDDTAGAGLRSDGNPQLDTNNDGIGSIARPGDWRGILLDQNSNDRNVALILEQESTTSSGIGVNGTVLSAQVLGQLAPSAASSDENLRLGFQVNGVLSQPGDVDVYSFVGAAGTEVWVDIDNTTYTLDTVVELLDANGTLLARSDNSTDETTDPNLLLKTSAIAAQRVNPLNKQTVGDLRFNANGTQKEDGTTNQRDAGLRVILPGATGSTTGYFFRIRSAGSNLNNVNAGLTAGVYKVQVRMREAQEFPGSVVTGADIRYATNGVHLRGLPAHSPLLGEAREDESVRPAGTGTSAAVPDSQIFANNDVPWSYWPRQYFDTAIGVSQPESNGVRPQYVGNVLNSDLAAISIAGNLVNGTDVDFYRFNLTEQDVSSNGFSLTDLTFDIDYSDGLNRPDTSLAVYALGGVPGNETWQLIYVGDASNISEDQRLPLSGTAAQEFSRGSFGAADPFINSSQLSSGDYLVAVHSTARVPSEFSGTGAPVILASQQTVDPLFGTTINLDLSQYVLADNPLLSLTTLGFAANSLFQVNVTDGVTSQQFPLSGNGIRTFSLASFAGSPNVIIDIPVTQAGGGATIPTIQNVFVTAAEQAARRVPIFQIASAARPTIDLAAPAASRTVPIDLSGYVKEDLPYAYFDYSLVNAGDLNVQLVSSKGTTNNSFVTALDTTGRVRQAKVDLGFHAGASDLRVIFSSNNPTAVTVTNIIAGFAERGERVIAPARTQASYFTNLPLLTGTSGFVYQRQSSYLNQLFTTRTVPATTTVAGDYQLEIRKSKPLTITDTNDRDSISTTLIVPSSVGIVDGQVFTISDGANSVDFEFNVSGGVGNGRVAIQVFPGDSAAVIASRIRDAINNPGVQSRFLIRASGGDGLVTGALSGDRVNLYGSATVSGFFSAINSNVLRFSGEGDENAVREQGQVIISGNFIRYSRDYGVWSEAGSAEHDQRDLVDTYSATGNLVETGAVANGTDYNPTAIIQARPALTGSSPGPARNLQQSNSSIVGGFNTGIVVANNILEQGGLGGVQIAGENPIWMITPDFLPQSDNDRLNTINTHAASAIFDGDTFWLTTDRTRVGYEFEDIAGANSGQPDFGSGTIAGNGWNPDHVPIYYREDNGALYLRSLPPTTPWGYSALELMHAFRDSVNGSILVTNGTTQVVKATIAMSLLQPAPVPVVVSTGTPVAGDLPQPLDAYLSTTPGLNYANRPALFLEGVSGVGFQSSLSANVVRNPWDIRRVDKAESTQPFARIVNNTIIGNDGRASFNPDATVSESNDTISTAVQTQQGTGHTPLGFTMTAAIGDNPTLRDNTTDVDFYQFKLGIGDRVQIDIDSPATNGVDTALQIFDSSGRLVQVRLQDGTVTTIIDQDQAPGEAGAGNVDPYVDYTGLKAGVYYAAVSASGNTSFDPQSLVGRTPGAGTGTYTIGITVLHPQTFTITVEEPDDYANGETFEIAQISDLPGGATNVRTFEFTNNGNFTPGNIPVYIGPNYRIPDVARSIANAIRDSGMDNLQNLANGIDPVTGAARTANPLNPVTAFALGGQDAVAPSDDGTGELGGFGGIHPGIRLFPLRNDGLFVTPIRDSWFGLGHNRMNVGTNLASEAFGAPVNRGGADGIGTTEKFVVIQNAAWIRSNGNIRVDPDFNSASNLDQLLPETGIMVSAGASPTILNNVFYNVQTPIVREESRTTDPGNPIDYSNDFSYIPASFGSASRDTHFKPGQVIVGGSVYQFSEPGIARNRQLLGNVNTQIGIEANPTNIPNTGSDFNFTALSTDQLFVNAQAGQYLPARGSRLIDSSIDSLTERSSFDSIKRTSGIASSPIIAPSRDGVGQLRVDDPEVSPPQGLGANVFKDRGALDRSDFVGPTAKLLVPIDNDANFVDRDPASSLVQLQGGVYPEFRLQLSDSLSDSDPFPGVGVDDDTVVGPNQAPVRLPGAALTITEDGRTLSEGIDYSFSYNPTTKEIILTPLAGVWRDNRVYEITLNNRDRFVLNASSGEQVDDGTQFQVVDSNGGVVTFEYDSGYRLQLPQGLTLNIPTAGAGAGGIADGSVFQLSIPNGALPPRIFNFELDSNFTFDAANIRVPFLSTDSAAVLAKNIFDALVAANTSLSLGIQPKLLTQTGGPLFIGAPSGSLLTTTNTAFSQPSSTLAIVVPVAGAQVGGVTDGQSFVLFDGTTQITFEFDSNNNVTPGRTPINLTGAFTASDVANAIQTAIAGTNLTVSPLPPANTSPTNPSGSLLYLNLPSTGTIDVRGSSLSVSGISRNLNSGDSITVTNNGLSKTFIFTSIPLAPAVDVIQIPLSLGATQDELGILLADAIRTAGLGLQPRHLGNGNIAVGGTNGTLINLSANANVGLFGQPGVMGGTALDVNGSLVLNVPAIGGGAIPDNRIFTITRNGVTTAFEFDQDGSGPTIIGNITIPYAPNSTSTEIAGFIAAAISSSTLGIVPRILQTASNADAKVDIGLIPTTAVNVFQTNLTTSRGAPVDGEFFTVNTGTQTVVFEFDNTTINNGISANRRSIAYNDFSTQAQIAASIVAAINGANLGIVATANGNIVLMNDKPTFTYTFGTAPSLLTSGLAGGAKPIIFTRDPSFTSVDMRIAIVKAINAAADTTLRAGVRSGNSLYIDNAVSLSANTSNFFLRGIQDLADNNLQATRQNGETQFTILMPGTVLDFGNAPDPFTNAPGRYATTFDSDGARHVVIGNGEIQQVGWDAGISLGGTFTLSHNGQTTTAIPSDASAAVVQAALEALPAIGVGNVVVTTLPQLSGSANVRYELTFVGTRTALDAPETTIDISLLTGNSVKSAVAVTTLAGVGGVRLGKYVSGELDATITPSGSGDTGNDGVTITSTALSTDAAGLPVFNRNISTFITVTASGPGFLSGWIDFNGDGDWDDANEQIDFNNSLALVASGRPVNNFLEFTLDRLTQVIEVTVPSTAPVPNSPINSFARFRYSSANVLLPTGLATDGEVEDYAITIVGGNPPVATNVNYGLVEDQSGGLQVTSVSGLLALGNVTDPDGPSRVGFSVTLVDAPLHSSNTFVLNPNGSFTYTPEADFFGTDTFTYRVFDGILGSLNIGTVTLTVQPVNDAPVVPPKNVNIFKNQSYTISANDLLNVGNTAGPANESNQTIVLTAVNTTSANGGTVTLVNGSYVYQAPVNFVGTDSFTYIVTDNGTTAGSAAPLATTGTVVITIADRNTPPVAVADAFSTSEDPILIAGPPVVFGVSRPFSFFTGNDSASDGLDPNEMNQTVALTAVSATSAAGGTVVIQNGNVIYTPPLNFNGTDTFTYTITDTGNPPASSVGTVTVTVGGVNDDPVQLLPLGVVNAAEDAVVTPINLSQFFTDPDLIYGDVLTYSVDSNSNPSLVTPAISPAGFLQLPLTIDQNGTATIVIRATDIAGRSVTNTLTLNVGAAVDPAKSVAQIPTQNVNEDAPPINIVLSPTYFINPDNAANPAAGLTYIASSSNPTLVQTSIVNGSLRLTLQPNAFGNATITVTANNGTGPVTQTFNINVASVNDGPSTVADVYSVPVNFVLRASDRTGASTGNSNDNGVLANDSDVEGNTFTARLVGQPARGSVTFSSDGTFSYVPNVGSTVGQSDTFTYIAADSLGTDSSVTTVTLNFTTAVTSPHQNPDTRWQSPVGNTISSPDVNADGFVSPIDALLIINYLNDQTSERRVPFMTLATPPFRDVDGNMLITPLDILQVITFLNARSNLGSGEGEAAVNASAGTVIASAAPVISNGTSWSMNVLNGGNNMIPMQNIQTVAGRVSDSTVKQNSTEAPIDYLMSGILGVNTSASESEYDYLATSGSLSDSAFDQAISDLFDTTPSKSGDK